MVKEETKVMELRADSDREFFLIHGYTGSTTDFNHLPKLLNKKFNANVKVICLKGHGTKIEDLDDVTYEDLFNQIENELKKDFKKNRQIILGGVSLGGLFALIFSSKYSSKVKGVFDVCIPYNLKFPFNFKPISLLGIYKKYWKKPEFGYNRARLEEDLSYRFMHANGLKIVKRARKELDKVLHLLNCPIVSIHSHADYIGSSTSVDSVHEKVKSYLKAKEFLHMKMHNIFFSMNNKETYSTIIDFVKDNKLFERGKDDKVAAVIPSLNEAPRIGDVLDVVTKSKAIDEVIVIDDGSTDNTEEVVRKYKKVKYIKNAKNIGKAGSMDKGVNSTDAGIIFFCDADLIGLNQKMVREIVMPVKEGKFNMFMGLRGNAMQKTVHLFAINTGERAIRRAVWEKLPSYFKYKYRVEAGLNYYVRKYFGGFGYKRFNYSQPIKEKKYGFIKGTFLRWAMNMDVLSAYIYDFFKR